ncbi:uncharacterized [Tachysurus ichikawai]
MISKSIPDDVKLKKKKVSTRSGPGGFSLARSGVKKRNEAKCRLGAGPEPQGREGGLERKEEKKLARELATNGRRAHGNHQHVGFLSQTYTSSNLVK